MTDFDYKKFLEEKHAKYQTAPDVINNIIKKTTGRNAINTERLIKGEANEVYKIELDNNTEVILRISRNETNPFIPEAWAMEACEKLGVPVAKVLGIDEAETDSRKIYACVLSKIEGVPLREVRNEIDQDIIHTIISKSGEYLSLINSIKTEGFGHIVTGAGGAEKPTYHDYIVKKANDVEEFVKAAKKNNLNPKLIHDAIEILLQSKGLFKNENYILAHGDFGTRHIMINDNQISGVLDFGNMRSSFPVHDFAWWDIWSNNSQELEWLKEGYVDKSIFSDNFLKKFHTIKLLLGLEILWWNSLEEHLIGVESAKHSITADLKYLQ